MLHHKPRAFFPFFFLILYHITLLQFCFIFLIRIPFVILLSLLVLFHFIQCYLQLQFNFAFVNCADSTSDEGNIIFFFFGSNQGNIFVFFVFIAKIKNHYFLLLVPCMNNQVWLLQIISSISHTLYIFSSIIIGITTIREMTN